MKIQKRNANENQVDDDAYHLDVHIGQEIRQEVKRQHQSAQWLANELNCNRTNVYNIFTRKSIATDLLVEVSRILNRDFFALYSSTLNLRKKRSTTIK